MKTMKVICVIFLIIGLVVLGAGLSHSAYVVNTYNQVGLGQILGTQLIETLFWNTFEPYLIGSIIMFIIGGIGIIAVESESTPNIKTSSTYENTVKVAPPTLEINQQKTVVSSKSTILCGSCNAINDIDAVFCKKCGTQFR